MTAPKLHRAAKLMADSVTELMNAEQYKAALKLKRKFHHYSLNNCWLIALQFPTATQVAGYKRWQELGRQVKKGEKSIAILAPLIKRDKETDERKVIGFRTASVFDLYQTEGPELPSLPKPQLLTEDSSLIQASIRALAKVGKHQTK